MKIRLYHPNPLQKWEGELPPEESHYLCKVLRAKSKDTLYLFNPNDGEWHATILAAHPKKCRIRIEKCSVAGHHTPELHLCFAPIKRSRISTIFAMATELGVTHIHPVLTRYTHAPLGHPERIEKQLVEASEQCERLDIPELMPVRKWHEWLKARKTAPAPLLACVERGDSRPMRDILQDTPSAQPHTLLIGPEGGFSDQELQDLQQLPQCDAVHLCAHILRSETAVAAALAQYQAITAKSPLSSPKNS